MARFGCCGSVTASAFHSGKSAQGVPGGTAGYPVSTDLHPVRPRSDRFGLRPGTFVRTRHEILLGLARVPSSCLLLCCQRFTRSFTQVAGNGEFAGQEFGEQRVSKCGKNCALITVNPVDKWDDTVVEDVHHRLWRRSDQFMLEEYLCLKVTDASALVLVKPSFAFCVYMLKVQAEKQPCFLIFGAK